MTTGNKHLITKDGFLYPRPATPAPDFAIPYPAPRLDRTIDRVTPANPGNASNPAVFPIILFKTIFKQTEFCAF